MVHKLCLNKKIINKLCYNSSNILTNHNLSIQVELIKSGSQNHEESHKVINLLLFTRNSWMTGQVWPTLIGLVFVQFDWTNMCFFIRGSQYFQICAQIFPKCLAHMTFMKLLREFLMQSKFTLKTQFLQEISKNWKT